MADTILVRMKVKPEKEAEFRAIMVKLAATVKANEPDCLYYDLFKAPGEHEYWLLEGYVDAEARRHHEKSEYTNAVVKEFFACLEGRPSVEKLDHVER
jgi:quinol monooxygenase YgiN